MKSFRNHRNEPSTIPPRSLVVLLVLLLSTGLVAARDSSARTIYVEKDGTGDYSVIQNAVDAAASGDTIRIGPGRYEDRAVVTTPGWSVPVYVLVQVSELTLIGAGRRSTIIGQSEPWDITQPLTKGVEAGSYWGSEMVVVRDMGFENIYHAVTGFPAPDYDIRSCEFDGNYYGINTVDNAEIAVVDCRFSNQVGKGKYLWCSRNSELLVANSEFILNPHSSWSQSAALISGVGLVSFDSCRFVDGDHAISLVGVGSTAFRSCSFYRHTYESINCSNSVVEVYGSVFEGSGYAVRIDGYGSIVNMHESFVSDAVWGSVRYRSLGQLMVNNCVLDKGERWVVEESYCNKSSRELPRLDMRHNDWGTTSADSIEAWINTCDFEVDYVPFVGMPVAVEGVEWGLVKSMYR